MSGPQVIYGVALNSREWNAARRIRASLEQRGIWMPAYGLSVEIAAQACDRYLCLSAMRRDPEVSDPDGVLATTTADALRTARLELVEVLMLTPDRVALGAVNGAGEDALIASLCEPLEYEDGW